MSYSVAATALCDHNQLAAAAEQRAALGTRQGFATALRVIASIISTDLAQLEHLTPPAGVASYADAAISDMRRARSEALATAQQLSTHNPGGAISPDDALRLEPHAESLAAIAWANAGLTSACAPD